MASSAEFLAEYSKLCEVDNNEKIRRQPSLNTIARITWETSDTVNQIMMLVVQLFALAADAAADASAASFAKSVQVVRGVVFNASQAVWQLEQAAWLAAQHALGKGDVQAERFASREEAAYHEAKRLLVGILRSFDAALKVVSQVAAPTDVSVASVGAALEIKLAALQVAEDVLTAWKSAARSADYARGEADPVYRSRLPWQFELFSEMVSRLDEDLTWKAARDEALEKRIKELHAYGERNNDWD